ncbi:MAG: ArdC-like ssDNA-binding domain-containing protein [Phycisphaerales bacterium]
MKAEDAKKIADNALEQLAASLKAGKSEQLTRYLAAMGRFHRYSFGNILLIACQRPDASHVAGFTTWKSFNRFVKKGEKGIVILAPMSIKPKDEQPESREQPAEQAKKPILRFRAVHVFDIAQTDGDPLPEHAAVSGDPAQHLDRLKAHTAELGIELAYEQMTGGTYGMSQGKRIVIREGLPAAEEFAVLAHELAHELLHRGEDRPESKTVRETEAEAVAFVVCQAVGLNTGTTASDYIQLYRGNSETLAASLERIQRTAAGIIAAVCHQRQPAIAV